MSVRFGVVGVGHIGKRHCENILAVEGAELWGVCDTEPIDAETLKSWGLDTQHTDLEQFVAGAFDVLVVSTPNNLHKHMTILGVEHGKAVLCEKPLTLSKQDAHAIDEIVKALEGTVYVDMPMRHLPAIKKVNEMLESGDIGRIHSVTMNILWNRNKDYYDASEWRGTIEQEGGPFFNEFIHHLDIVMSWVGELWPLSMIMKNATHEYNEVEDIGLIQFAGSGGLMGQLHYTTAAHEKSFDNVITIVAEGATIRISGMMLEKIEIDDEVIEYGVNMEHFTKVFRDIVRDMNGKKNNAVNHITGMQAVSFICDAYSMADRFY